jgi:hypothetical protein
MVQTVREGGSRSRRAAMPAGLKDISGGSMFCPDAAQPAAAGYLPLKAEQLCGPCERLGRMPFPHHDRFYKSP